MIDRRRLVMVGCRFVLCLLLMLAAYEVAADAAPPAALIPAPLEVRFGAGAFELTADTSVETARRLPGAARAVRLLLGPATGFDFPAAARGTSGSIRVHYDASLGAEAYRLHVGDRGVEIRAADEAGVFYAVQTLRQLLPASIYSTAAVAGPWRLPAVTIADRPRFRWRGLHLDVSRHFMPVTFVRKYIDLLALHKMNTFHWHLTDDQGWRLEIERYPQLTAVGSVRARTLLSHPFATRAKAWEFEERHHGGFYTRQEVRDIVAYAAERHVNVVPEIEFPGHAQAAIAAYPELGNTGKRLRVKEDWGISRYTLSPAPGTIEFYRNVLAEVLELFPSKYIHIGGDEALVSQWRESAYAQRRMRELGLADERELQSWMIRQLKDFLDERGRRLVGWDEITRGGMGTDAVVMAWRGFDRGVRAAGAGHDVVMAPTSHTYLDYYQADPGREPLALGFYLPLRRVYAFDPAPVSLPASVRAHILGAQGQVWTEFMRTPAHVEYMAYPRAAALSEVLWSPQAARRWEDFEGRLPGHLARLDALDVNYRQPGDDRLSWIAWLRNCLWTTGVRIYHWYSDR